MPGPLERGRDSNNEPLVLIDIPVMVAILITIVPTMMVEFYGGIAVAPVVSRLILEASRLS